MKTIASLFFAFGLVAVSNAANVKWGVSAAAADQNGYLCYLVSSRDDSWTSVADIVSAADGLGSGTAGVIKSSRGGTYLMPATEAMGVGITKDSMKTASIIVVSSADAKSYSYYDVDFSSFVYGENDPASDPVTPSMSDIAKNVANFAGGPGPGPGPDPEPEPTSAMLMMLGVAGLALRRRAK